MCMIFDVYIKVKKLNIRPEKRGGKKVSASYICSNIENRHCIDIRTVLEVCWITLRDSQLETNKSTHTIFCYFWQ